MHYALVLLGLLHPLWVEYPAKAWMAFGKAVGHVMSYPLFAILYYFAVTPTALLVRLFGKDPLRLKREDVESYWLPHEPPDHERYKRQF